VIVESNLVFVWGKIGLAALLGLGGIIALVSGHRLLRGRAGHNKDGSVIEWKGVKITVGTIGAGVMITACVWAYCSYQVAPKTYARKSEITEERITRALPVNEDMFVSVAGPQPSYLTCRQERQLTCKPALKPGEKCGSAPRVDDGLGRLQVAAAYHTTEEARSETIRNERRQLLAFLAKRKETDWSKRLMKGYHAPEGNRMVARLVFNGVPPELEKPMCNWLACEGWTFGPCMMVPRPERPEEVHYVEP
jgi:hypothetical protein